MIKNSLVIRDIIKRDLQKKIEEVIKVDQFDEDTVYSEITEYIATEKIKTHYQTLFKAIAEGPAGQDESIGIWISGFFGSGKSSFAKNLGYALTNQVVKGKKASDLLLDQLEDEKCRELLDFINKTIPMEAIMLDISTGTDVVKSDEKIAVIMYRALLKKLNYSTDFEIAELEIALERDGHLNKFIALFDAKHAPSGGKAQWTQQGRSGAFAFQKASTILNQMDSLTFPTPESWDKSTGNRKVVLTIDEIINRTFELIAKRMPGKSLIFILDEVGQYVSRSSIKIEDLRAVVEQFGKESKNRIKKKEIKAPIWIAVTSQEKLNEVVNELDNKKIDIAKLQDRFKHIDLMPSDISEVTTKRVLAKTVEGERKLGQMFENDGARLNTAARLEKSHRFKEITKNKFIDFYPYLPHYIDLSIDIVSGLRLQSGAPKHMGAGARTIIKQAYEMLVSEKTSLADKPIGNLVTLDKVYDLVDMYLASEKQKDILDVGNRFSDEPKEIQEWTVKVAKALALLEFVRDLKRTEANIAALLIGGIGENPPLEMVRKALELLVNAQFVKDTEDGFKLLSAKEKTWESEKANISRPKPKEINDIKLEIIRSIFDEPQLKKPNYKGVKTFGLALRIDDRTVFEEGKIALILNSVETPDMLGVNIEEIVDESRQKPHESEIFIVFSLNPELDELIRRKHVSESIIKKYRSDLSKLNPDEARCLSNEEAQLQNTIIDLKRKFVEVIVSGVFIFRGLKRDGSSLGTNLDLMMKVIFDETIPKLYPKMEMGAIKLTGSESEELLKATNLKNLPSVFLNEPKDSGLGFIVQKDGRYILSIEAPITQEIFLFIKGKLEYGEPVSGKALEDHFTGLVYGWDTDIVRLGTAALLRAGCIEMMLRGVSYTGISDVKMRKPFELRGGIQLFRSAEFSITEVIDNKVIMNAALSLEGLTGKEVNADIDSINEAMKALVKSELNWMKSTRAIVEALHLPALELVGEYMEKLEGFENNSAPDCVKSLADSGAALKERRQLCMKLRDILEGSGRESINNGRLVLDQMMVQLGNDVDSDIELARNNLQNDLNSETFFDKIGSIKKNTRIIQDKYRDRYHQVHMTRMEKVKDELDRINGRPEALNTDRGTLDIMLKQLSIKGCNDLKLELNKVNCENCHASIKEMEAEIVAIESIARSIVNSLKRSNEPPLPPGEISRKVERIRIADHLPQSIASVDEAEMVIEKLREMILKLLEDGSTIELE
jgi:hypothetical protein